MNTLTLSKMTIDDLEPSFLEGKRVFMRVDFNVPMKGGKISDDTRIQRTLPTIEKLRTCGAKLVLASHLGRPKGSFDAASSLRPVAARLGELLGSEVTFSDEIIGPVAVTASMNLDHGGIMLLENVRFDPGEKKNDPAFAEELSKLGDLYVNDAFGTCHRAHASTVGVPTHLRPAVAGFLVKKELEVIDRILISPERPFIAILGGAKISDKIEVFNNLLGIVDMVIVGGAMASTFFRASCLGVGTSFVEEELAQVASGILEVYKAKNIPIVLPDDCVVSKSTSEALDMDEVPSKSIPAHCAYVDIGSTSRSEFAEKIRSGKTVVWNGPMGIFEVDEFAGGTRAVAEAVAQAAQSGAVTLVGGGDSVKAVIETGFGEHIGHLSTGGGAFLKVLGGEPLPGVEALSEREGGSV